MGEFEEILHTGGKLEFIKNGNAISVQFVNYSFHPSRIHQIIASPDGALLDITVYGVPAEKISYPQPSIPVILFSDKQGLFGRICKKCNSYFRTSWMTNPTTCPYCSHQGHHFEFITENQITYIKNYCIAFINANFNIENAKFDFDELIKNLPNNKSPWVHSETEQQHKSICQECKTEFDILGEYGLCPCCCKPNALEIINKKFNEFEQQLQNADSNILDRHEREIEWEKLLRCVSEFEGLANELRRYLLQLPLAPKRKKELSSLSFQNLIKANESILSWYGFEILKGISPDDRKFLNIMFNRRHLFTHKNGQVDEEYINNTQDESVKLKQKIRLSSNEIKRLIPLVKLSAQNFILSFESIQN